MTRVVVSDQQAGFAGGLNSVSDPAFLRPDQARQMANFRLSNYGAALKRLGTQFVSSAAVSTYDTTNSVYGGIYWPTLDKVYAIGGSAGSSAMTLWETRYGLPVTWSPVGTVMQYRPVIFTDGTTPEVMYLAGDNTHLVQKVVPAYNTIGAANANAGANAGGATSIVWSQTVSPVTDGVLVVQVMADQPASSVVWDASGTPRAFARFATYTASGGTVELWYLVAPTVGTQNITVTFGAATTGHAAGVVFSNVNQSTPFETSSPRTATGLAGTQPSVALPTQSTDMVVDIVTESNADALTAGGGQTAIYSGVATGNGSSYRMGEVGSTTMAWTGVTGDWVHMAAALVPTTPTPDLTIATLNSTTAAVKGLVVYNDRLWGWNGFGAPNALFYSELSAELGSTGGDSLGDPANGGGTIIVRTFGISEIVACAPVGGSLLIFHERGISRLTGFGQDDISVAPQALTADVGMANATPSGVCVYGNVAYFVSDRGIYSATEASVAPLSTPDKPDPTAALLANGTVNPSQFELDYNRQYNEVWVSIQDYGVFIYNTILQSWSGPFTGTYADGTRAIFEVVSSASGNSHLWRITWRNATGMFVSECDRAATYKDDVTSSGSGGSAITATLQLHRLFGGDRVYAKSWRWLNVLAQLTAGATPPVASFMTPLSNPGDLTFSGLTSIEQPYYLSPGGTGAYLDATITDAGSTGPSQYALATAQGNLLGQR